ncbi:hypothetical protein LCGC14_2251440 [marine sediment metagenome]|uniref:Uncharacterized protein n=1 Tax=marine sediment metagenome TaxID=412755 RepID=A0A0F9DPY5_9ZZZZ
MKRKTIITLFLLAIFAIGMFVYLKRGNVLGASEETLAKTAWIEYSTLRWRGAGLIPDLMIAEEWPRDKEDIIRRYRAGDFGSYL